MYFIVHDRDDKEGGLRNAVHGSTRTYVGPEKKIKKQIIKYVK